MKPIIAVIDSGIKKKFVSDNFLYEILLNNKHSSLGDKFGHGTACAMVIKSLCEDAHFISIPILNDEGFSSSEILEEALTYCLDIDCNIINLSLSILDNRNKKVKNLCQELTNKNKIILSSVRNNFIYSEPATYRSVIGVRGNIFSSTEEYWFNPNYKVQLISDVTPVFTNPELNKHFIFSGNSKATAVATGLLARIISQKKSFNIEEILSDFCKNSTRNKWSDKESQEGLKRFMKGFVNEGRELESKEYHRVILALKNVCKDYKIEVPEDLNISEDLFKKGIITPQIVIPFLRELEDEFKVPVNILNMKPHYLISLKSIYYAIRRIQVETY